MKRELVQNIKVTPYTSGEAIDREGFLSAIFAAKVTAGEKVKIAVTHSDTSDGTFEAVPDDFIVIGKSDEAEVTAPATVNFDLDLLGCKQYIKVTATLTGTGAAATYAVALGDPANMPV